MHDGVRQLNGSGARRIEGAIRGIASPESQRVKFSINVAWGAAAFSRESLLPVSGLLKPTVAVRLHS